MVCDAPIGEGGVLRLTGRMPPLTQLPLAEALGRRGAPELRRLFAGANDIADAHPAFELPCAVHVGLAHNRIAALPPPEVTARAEALMSLDLTHNDLCDASDAFASLRAMPSLRALSLAGNPMAMGTGFAARVANELPELLMLDGARLEHAARGPIPSMDEEEAKQLDVQDAKDITVLKTQGKYQKYAENAKEHRISSPPRYTSQRDGEEVQ